LIRNDSCPYIYRPAILKNGLSNGTRILVMPEQIISGIKNPIWCEGGLISPQNTIGK